MTTIRYRLSDGHFENVEVTADFKRGYEAMVREERRIERKETRRCVSLDGLLAREGENGEDGRYEYLLADFEADPAVIVIRQEDEVRALQHPMFINLTVYQRRVAAAHYLEHKSPSEIAREAGVTKQAVAKLLHKIVVKIARRFDGI
jgi:DNA-directed RNA polymerase specialized sigma24 family protein